MKHLIIFVGLVSLVVSPSCGDNNSAVESEKLPSTAEARKTLLGKIDSLEAVVYTDDFSVNQNNTADLMQAYMRYTAMYVGDKDKTPEYLYKAAAISRAVGLPAKAIKLYDQILSDYPTYERNSEVAFLMAFTYDEDAKDKELAKAAYQEVIEKFPGGTWANQAAERLKTIDMSDEEMIKKFMQQNKMVQSGGSSSS